jgi:TonB family protein
MGPTTHRLQLVGVVFFLSLSGRAGTHSFTWNPPKLPLSVSSDLQVRLIGTSNSDWILGFRAVDGNEATAVAGEVAVNDKGHYRELLSISDWPLSRFLAGPGVAQFTALNAGNYLFYITVPRGTTVHVAQDFTEILTAKVEDSLMVRKGIIVPVPVKGGQTLLIRFASPARMPVIQSRETFFTPDGRVMATPRGLASHLLTLVKPYAQVPPANGVGVTVRVTISESGHVTNVVHVNGQSGYSAAVENAVRQWKFSPFLKNGVRTPVTASVMFFFDPSGEVTSPVFSELSR